MATPEIRALQAMFPDEPNIWVEPPRPRTPPPAVQVNDESVGVALAQQTQKALAGFDSETEAEIQVPKPPKQPKAKKVRKSAAATKMMSPEKLGQIDFSSSEPRSMDETGLGVGESASSNERFCPWHLLVKYPELYVGNANRPRVRPYFEKVLELQQWDFYYVYARHSDIEPIILVPSTQLSAFLDSINVELTTRLCIPEGKVSEKFENSFSRPLPRFLGRTAKADDLAAIRKATPGAADEDDPDHLPFREKDAFNELIQSIKNSDKPEKGKEKRREKMQEQRRKRHKEWATAAKRMQRYLGLRQGSTTEMELLALDMESPFELESDVVFVCIDLETYERYPSMVTEIGVVTLDTRDLKGVAPGEDGKTWMQKIKAHHIRVRENAHNINTDFVMGWPHMFNFGESDHVYGNKIKQALTKILPDASRNIVLVGHDVQGDVQNLKPYPIGFNFYDLPNLFDLIDNQWIQHRRLLSMNAPSLELSLRSLGMDYRYLHNAGNDAMYTLQTLICAIVRKTHFQGLHLPPTEEQLKMKNDPDLFGEGWSSDEEDDGGLATRPIDPKPFETMAAPKVMNDDRDEKTQRPVKADPYRSKQSTSQAQQGTNVAYENGFVPPIGANPVLGGW